MYGQLNELKQPNNTQTHYLTHDQVPFEFREYYITKGYRLINLQNIDIHIVLIKLFKPRLCGAKLILFNGTILNFENWNCISASILTGLFEKGLKLGCDSRFQRAFTACNCIYKVPSPIYKGIVEIFKEWMNAVLSYFSFWKLTIFNCSIRWRKKD